LIRLIIGTSDGSSARDNENLGSIKFHFLTRYVVACEEGLCSMEFYGGVHSDGLVTPYSHEG
jgi:hypothetical protein